MIARKCDRCGLLYEEPKDGEVCGFRWAIGPHWYLGKLIDLCPDCTDMLSDWMDGERTEILGDKFLSEVER